METVPDNMWLPADPAARGLVFVSEHWQTFVTALSPPRWDSLYMANFNRIIVTWNVNINIG